MHNGLGELSTNSELRWTADAMGAAFRAGYAHRSATQASPGVVKELHKFFATIFSRFKGTALPFSEADLPRAALPQCPKRHPKLQRTAREIGRIKNMFLCGECCWERRPLSAYLHDFSELVNPWGSGTTEALWGVLS